jgi:hypothetical protein
MMRFNSYDMIREDILRQFEKEFPGEAISDSAFGVYMLHRYCEMVERIAINLYLAKNKKEL